MEALNKEIKSSLKEMEEKANKKLEEINKSFKESREYHEKTTRQVKETVQVLEIQIEAIQKTQTEGILNMEKECKWTGTTGANITNRIQEMEENLIH